MGACKRENVKKLRGRSLRMEIERARVMSSPPQRSLSLVGTNH